MKKTVVPALILAAVCLVIVSLLVLTESITAERIAAAETAAKEESVRSVLVGADQIESLANGSGYVGKTADGAIVGYAFENAAKGYGGDVVTVVGIAADGTILGVSVRASDETPGLGANVTKDKFTSQFIGKDEKDNFIFGDDITAVTGASYSSAAVREGIRAAIAQFRALENK